MRYGGLYLIAIDFNGGLGYLAMRRLPISGGCLTISDEIIEIDKSVGSTIGHIWNHSKIMSLVLILGALYLVATAILGSSFSRLLVIVGVVVLVGYFSLAFFIHKFFRDNVTTDKIIPRDAVEMIVYKEGGWIRQPNLAIIYTEDGERMGRNVFLLPSWLGEDAPLERILPAVEEENIDTKSVNEVNMA